MLEKFLSPGSKFVESMRCYEFTRTFYVPNVGYRTERVYSRTLEFIPNFISYHADTDEVSISLVFMPIHFICTWITRKFTGDRYLEFSRNVSGHLSQSDNLLYVTRIDQLSDNVFVLSFSNGGITPVRINKMGVLDAVPYNTIYVKGE